MIRDTPKAYCKATSNHLILKKLRANTTFLDHKVDTIVLSINLGSRPASILVETAKAQVLDILDNHCFQDIKEDYCGIIKRKAFLDKSRFVCIYIGAPTNNQTIVTITLRGRFFTVARVLDGIRVFDTFQSIFHSLKTNKTLNQKIDDYEVKISQFDIQQDVLDKSVSDLCDNYINSQDRFSARNRTNIERHKIKTEESTRGELETMYINFKRHKQGKTKRNLISFKVYNKRAKFKLPNTWHRYYEYELEISKGSELYSRTELSLKGVKTCSFITSLFVQYCSSGELISEQVIIRDILHTIHNPKLESRRVPFAPIIKSTGRYEALLKNFFTSAGKGKTLKSVRFNRIKSKTNEEMLKKKFMKETKKLQLEFCGLLPSETIDKILDYSSTNTLIHIKEGSVDP